MPQFAPRAGVGMVASLSESECAGTEFETFKHSLRHPGIPFVVGRASDATTATWAHRERGRAVIVDCGADLPLAWRVATLYFAEVLRSTTLKDREGRFSYIVKRDSPRLTGVSAPHIES